MCSVEFNRLSAKKRADIFTELFYVIKDHEISNYMVFYEYVIDNYSEPYYLEAVVYYSDHFGRLLDSNFIILFGSEDFDFIEE